MLLLNLPFYVECMNLQVAKKKQTAQSLIRRLESKLSSGDGSTEALRSAGSMTDLRSKAADQKFKQEVHFRRVQLAQDILLSDINAVAARKKVFRSLIVGVDDISDEEDGYGGSGDNDPDDPLDGATESLMLAEQPAAANAAHSSSSAPKDLFFDEQLEAVVQLCHRYCRNPGGREMNSAFSYKELKCNHNQLRPPTIFNSPINSCRYAKHGRLERYCWKLMGSAIGVRYY